MSTGGMLRLFVTHWQRDWTLELQAALYCGIYLGAAWRSSGRWPARRTLSFLAGVGCVTVALQSGIDTYDDRLLSVHMVQHMLLLLLAPLLLLGGRPTLLVLRSLSGPRRRAFAGALRRLSRYLSPPVCLVVFAAVLVGTHLPSFYDATLRHPVLHDLEHVGYLLAGTLMWWPILGGDPVPANRLSGFGRLIYMLAVMPPMALIGAYLDREPTLVYPPYGPAGHAFGANALVDQAQAGAIMWVAGSMVVSAVGLWAAFAALLAEERRQQARDVHGAGLGVSLSPPAPKRGHR
jgi:putative membrane protein